MQVMTFWVACGDLKYIWAWDLTGSLYHITQVQFLFFISVPTIYPLDIYARLCMVDNLEKLGIDRHFREEIRTVLDETYR